MHGLDEIKLLKRLSVGIGIGDEVVELLGEVELADGVVKRAKQCVRGLRRLGFRCRWRLGVG